MAFSIKYTDVYTHNDKYGKSLLTKYGGSEQPVLPLQYILGGTKSTVTVDDYIYKSYDNNEHTEETINKDAFDKINEVLNNLDKFNQIGEFITKTNESGWTIKAKIQRDYYEWINYFEAEHETYGKLYGDYSNIIYAKSKEAFEHFHTHHYPEVMN